MLIFKGVPEKNDGESLSLMNCWASSNQPSLAMMFSTPKRLPAHSHSGGKYVLPGFFGESLDIMTVDRRNPALVDMVPGNIPFCPGFYTNINM